MEQVYLILPVILVVFGALSALLSGVFGGEVLAFFSVLASLLVAFVCELMLSPNAEAGRKLFAGLIYFDSLSVFSVSLILLATLACVLFSRKQIAKEGVDYPVEFYALMLLSAFGACLFSMAAQVLVLFVSLEIMSLALYCLCGSSIGRSQSSEAAMKYFVLGSLSSALMMYGFALIYVLTGKLDFMGIYAGLADINSPLVLLALAMASVGILLKISAFPFHFWTADVYQGAPAPVTAFMASVIKLASFSAAIRVFWLAFGSSVAFWSEFLPVIAVATMIIGTLMALRQTDVKRLLAFSSVAHSGYLMVGLMAGASDSQGISALLFYLSLYLVMTLGAFDVLGALIAEKGGRSDFSILWGLGKSRPTTALLLSFFILCLAGLPPGVAGLLAKIQLLSAGLKADYTWVVIIALLNSAVGCYYYLRLLKHIYRESEEVDGAVLEIGALVVSVICFIILLGFSVFPGILMSLCSGIATLAL